MSEQVLFQCQVLNIDDPLMLGRIRARRLIDNYDDILKSISDPPWNEEKDIWTLRDPFVSSPLLPYYVYSTPKVDEMVLVMYANQGTDFINRYYVQSTFYSPTATGFQYYQGGNKFMGTGIQIADPKPLKNQDGTFTSQTHKGVFPEPGDNSLLGRGSADVIVKEDEVLIRAGKFVGQNLEPNVLPVGNYKRGFLQLSQFSTEKITTSPSTITKFVVKTVSVNYLIEYAITNPENMQDKFTGSIYLYQLKPNLSTNSENLTVDSEIAENLKTLVYIENFTNLSKSETIKFINAFIKTCNDKNVSSTGTQLFNGSSKFPIFYRPTQLNYQSMIGEPKVQPVNTNFKVTGNIVLSNPGLSGVNPQYVCTMNVVLISNNDTIITVSGVGLTELDAYKDALVQLQNEIQSYNLGYVLIPTFDELKNGVVLIPQPATYDSGVIQKNLSDIYKGVKLNPPLKGGYGLIYAKGLVGNPTDAITKSVENSTVIYNQATYGALGSDKLFLLSHRSSIPGKGKINFADTLYGIPQEKFNDEIIPKTSSMVRGEELIELLNLMVRFLVGHVHPYPGLGPIPVTQDGAKVADIVAELQQAYTKILNSDIRLN